ncbi:hypothetical protein RD792_008153 [Penstemon davidsonii]|uniref:Pyrroline-5-carboxylate reductase n=1 Tax=Penstemon davidsonii TaxID=160366 RepID=A0ABR0D9A3_9LAMI|nr:hypothetical protein RD792_008153 [Penstemon davidsonii]
MTVKLEDVVDLLELRINDIDFHIDEDNVAVTPERTPIAEQTDSRPIGSKKAKKTKGKGKALTSAFMDDERVEENLRSAERLQLMLEEGRQRRHDEIMRLKKEEMRAREEEKEIRVFSMNTSEMTPLSKEYWRGKKQQIIQKKRLRGPLQFGGDSSEGSVVEDSDVVIFSVKPQVVKKVVLQLRPRLSEKQLLVSVVAGVKLKDLQEWAGHSRFIRVMPNTPAAVGLAASVISLGAAATKDDGELISKLFGSIGKVWTADEKLFDAVTGLSGSGPAYIYLAIEALADGGVAAGLPRELALGLASQTVLGAASMTANAGKHPGQLKDDVASPGGTTIAGIHELEKAGFRGILMNAVVAAAKRSKELSPS